MRHFIRAAALGAILALALPGAAFAATTTSVTTATVTVNGVISMTGIPATYANGSGVAGAILTGPPFTITVASSDPFVVSVAASDFVSGGNTIVADHTTLTFITGATSLDYTGPAGVPMEIGTTTPLTEKVKMILPLTAHAGTYTGTLTWTASN
jgi:hypothetical protein